MKRLAVVVMLITVSLPVLYIASTFYAAYFFEHDFTPISTEGERAAAELQYWLGADARDIGEARGLRYKSGMPPQPRFYYRFTADPAVIERLQQRWKMEPRTPPAPSESQQALPDWWTPAGEGRQYLIGLDGRNPMFLWYDPVSRTAYLHVRAES